MDIFYQVHSYKGYSSAIKSDKVCAVTYKSLGNIFLSKKSQYKHYILYGYVKSRMGKTWTTKNIFQVARNWVRWQVGGAYREVHLGIDNKVEVIFS